MAKKAKKTGDGAAASDAPVVAKPKGRKIAVVEGSDVPTFYVNNIHVDLSTFDVRLRMGQIVSGSPEQLNVKEIAYVYMAHAHARAFHTVLGNLLEKVEQVAPKAPTGKIH